MQQDNILPWHVVVKGRFLKTCTKRSGILPEKQPGQNNCTLKPLASVAVLRESIKKHGTFFQAYVDVNSSS